METPDATIVRVLRPASAALGEQIHGDDRNPHVERLVSVEDRCLVGAPESTPVLPLEFPDSAMKPVLFPVALGESHLPPDSARSFIPAGTIEPEFLGLVSALKRLVIARHERDEQRRTRRG